MSFKRMAARQLTDKAKRLIDERGGTDRLKRDAERLKEIASGAGTPKEKAKRAVDALKDPGSKGDAPGSSSPR